MAKRTARESTPEPPVEMCPGNSNAWGAKYHGESHPAFHRHPPCMVCRLDMGCVRCSGPAYELLCYRGKHWASEASLKEHGALVGR